MTSTRSGLVRIAGFASVTLVFAVTQPFVLVGLPLALLLVAQGPRRATSVAVAGALVALTLLGHRSDLWWFERGWPLLLAGTFIWMASWHPEWSFSAKALAALGMAAVFSSLIFAASPGAWLDLDASMSVRASQAADMAIGLLGGGADETLRGIMEKVTGLQVAVFPALLGVSSMGALGLAVTVRGWLAGERGGAVGPLRSFRFNDHLVWVWLVGLALILVPAGEIAERVGSNAVFFMGLLYVLRGSAVLLSLGGGISITARVLGGLLALIVYPLLALIVVVTLIVGLGDTWFNVRRRVQSVDGDR